MIRTVCQTDSFLLKNLVKRDFSQQYFDSYLGLAWAIVDPLAQTIILAIVFTVGFKASLEQDVPFFIFMFSGMVPYTFFAAGLQEGARAITSYDYIVKKTPINLNLFPVVKVFSSSLFHFIMVGFLFLSLFVYGIVPSIYWLQLVYYFLALMFFIYANVLFFSSICIIIPDILKLLMIIIRFLFYLTPVFWSTSNIPEGYHFILDINPLVYVVNGYRDSLIYQRTIFENSASAWLFWGPSFLLFFLGRFTFNKLKKNFVDLL